MGRADGIAAHLLHRLDLPDEGGLVDGGTQGAEVVVQADALDLAGHAVELEAAFTRHLDGADAEALRHLVERAAVLHQSDVCLI